MHGVGDGAQKERTMTAADHKLEDLRAEMGAAHLTPLWELDAEIMRLAPQPRTEPWLWRWDDLYRIAQRAGELVPVERGVDRRARRPGSSAASATVEEFPCRALLPRRQGAQIDDGTSDIQRLVIARAQLADRARVDDEPREGHA
jgi:hypothetical protein